MPTFQLIKPSGEIYNVPAQGLLIGRGRESQITVDDAKVSRRHAVVWTDGAQLFARDEGSTNGTQVNGRTIPPHVATPMQIGDALQVGPLALRVAAALESGAPVSPEETPVELESLDLELPAERAEPAVSRKSTLIPVLTGAGILVIVGLVIVLLTTLGGDRGDTSTAAAILTAVPAAGATTAAPEEAPTLEPTVAPTEAAPTVAPTEPPAPTSAPQPDAKVMANPLNVREGPGKQFAVLGKFEQGTPLTVLGQFGDCAWLQVEGAGTKGWVAAGDAFARLQRSCEGIPAGTWRPATGLIKQGSGSGLGELKVENGTAVDGVVVLVDPAGKPAMSAYVRQGATYILTKIADDTYSLYFSSGQGWNGKRFTERAAFQKFTDEFKFATSNESYTTWTVTLHEVAGGNAGSSTVDPAAFPPAE